jgi:hypothetical protein
MSTRFAHGLGLRQLTASTLSTRFRHVPSSSRVITTTLTFDVSTYTSSVSDPSPTDMLVAAKARDLLSSLERGDSNPSRPWGRYLDLLNYMGLERLPLEVHQLVLRKCVPSARVIRTASAREHRARYYPHAPHAYENRLQTVMKNIRSAGWQAELDDYHFILEQFAAVGHYVGSRRVLQEMAYAGIEPRTKTYSLCLHAVAHRLTLPCSEEQHPILIEESTKMARELLRDMHKRKIPFTSVNVDLAIRIMRETMDEKGFDDLIKFSYGIDLTYPDRLPLEIVEQQVASKAEVTEARDPPLCSLQPLSTSGLNVIVDMLGRSKRISKMVQTFEVLSQPLPKSSQSSISLFDEDEDDYSVNPPSPEPVYPLPFAQPNTATFQTLIMYAARADHVVFARHFLVQAMRLDREEDRRLKHGLRVLPVDEIAAPSLSVNRSMLLPVFGLSNRNKHVELMQWTLRMIKRTLRRKRKDLIWYTYKRSVRYGQGTALGGDVSGAGSDSIKMAEATKIFSTTAHNVQEKSLPSSTSSSGGDMPRGTSDLTSPPLVAQAFPPTESSTEFPTSSPNSTLPIPSTASSAQLSHLKSETPIFDLDLDSDHSYPAPPPRIFDINVHISLLQRDIGQLEQLSSDGEAVLGRTIHRIKERLGRRVWSGKDIWLAGEQARLPVTKKFWKEAANFVVPRVTKRCRGPSQREKRRRS